VTDMYGIAANPLAVALPKWPAMVVHGDPVTPEQAGNIIVRTESWYISSNDQDWARQVYEAIGISTNGDRHWVQPNYKDLDRFKADIGYVGEVDYLANDRIASAWVGGPHGWCDWNGHIGSDNYNIGKWPGAEDVFREWSAIAAAFPYLNLRCQLFSGETCEAETVPLIEYVVRDSEAVAQAPSAPLQRPRELTDAVVAGMFAPGRERGCSIEQLTRAVAAARASRTEAR